MNNAAALKKVQEPAKSARPKTPTPISRPSNAQGESTNKAVENPKKSTTNGARCSQSSSTMLQMPSQESATNKVPALKLKKKDNSGCGATKSSARSKNVSVQSRCNSVSKESCIGKVKALKIVNKRPLHSAVQPQPQQTTAADGGFSHRSTNAALLPSSSSSNQQIAKN